MSSSRNINIENVLKTPVEDQSVELVERKGIGHPDSIADGLAESVSRELSKEYQNRFDTILHHNTDETQIVAGNSDPKINGGELIEPIYVLLVGRATTRIGDKRFPTNRIAIKAAKDYLKQKFNHLNVEEDIILDSKLGETSTELQEVFDRKEVPCSNDTSFGVGFAPLSDTEELVYKTERLLYNLRDDIPAIGEDIKVMGLREDENISLTIACATVSSEIESVSGYVSLMEDLKNRIRDLSSKIADSPVEVRINQADNIEKDNIYLTVTGTSAEMGDDGSVGRGNRSNGLITPNRPMSMEASSGKNPKTHIGKIYNLLSNQIADDIATEIDEVKEVYVRLLSEIGQPINDPRSVSIQVFPRNEDKINVIRDDAEAITEEWLDNISEISKKVINGELKTF